jgi:hypothetical protein
MYFVPPNGGERFYLRTLLGVVRGPTSFCDLRTFEGTQYTTFQEACAARGLLQNDEEWHMCLDEAAQMQTGAQLQRLFATILLFCQPAQPNLLWMKYREQFCDDLYHWLELRGVQDAGEEEAYDYGLFLLNGLLEESGEVAFPCHNMRD